MFLDLTLKRNPGLVEAARALHCDGLIEPDTYVVDVETVAHNARVIASTAAQHGVEPWAVIKQIGRNPLLTRTIARHIPVGTAIDLREARALVANGARLGNVGHLVQIPRRALPEVLRIGTDHVTVYDAANLRAVNAAAAELGIVQAIIVRIAGDPEVTYPGQQGGFEPALVQGVLDLATDLPHVRVVGVTGFPCIVFDADRGTPRATATLDRVLQAADVLRDAGIEPVVSLPSHSSCSTIPLIAAAGGTHIEPGHAFTGSTPEHAVRDDLLERPAMVYVSEVVQEEPQPQIIGGGFYARGNARTALLGHAGDDRRARLIADPAENIDYYRRIEPALGDPAPQLGETAIMAFRAQIFVTRSRVAVVSGIAEGAPRVDGIFTALGDEVVAP